MPRPNKYSPELRERAVRMVFAHAAEHPLAVCDDSLRRRVPRDAPDDGQGLQ